MKKVIIIDDEALARSVVKGYLEAYPSFQLVAECQNGFEGVKAINEHQPDLVFLDIQMPKLNGFEMLELVEHQPSVIFTTAFDDYAIKAFDQCALDYLLKPFSKDRFDQAIEKFDQGNIQLEPTAALINPEIQNRIVVKDGSSISILPCSDVHYIEAYDDYVKIYTSKEKYVKKQTLSHFEKHLNPKDFIRIHRSFILNINYLHRIESYEKNSYRAILTNDGRVPISRSKYADLKKILGL